MVILTNARRKAQRKFCGSLLTAEGNSTLKWYTKKTCLGLKSGGTSSQTILDNQCQIWSYDVMLIMHQVKWRLSIFTRVGTVGQRQGPEALSLCDFLLVVQSLISELFYSKLWSNYLSGAKASGPNTCIFCNTFTQREIELTITPYNIEKEKLTSKALHYKARGINDLCKRFFI